MDREEFLIFALSIQLSYSLYHLTASPQRSAYKYTHLTRDRRLEMHTNLQEMAGPDGLQAAAASLRIEAL